jgi:hypothetical protein
LSPAVDFGVLGSQAYPGRLAVNWGAELVEPSGLRAIRRQAGLRLVRLGGIAPAHFGIPTRSVKYFCVEEIQDEELLNRYRIITEADRRRLALVRDGRGTLHTMERETLKPIIRRPGMLKGRIRLTPEVVGPWRLFSVQLSRDQLEARRWQHALRYIDYGAQTDFHGGARRPGGVVAERANVASRPIWWSVPTMPEGQGRVAWLIGRGDVHYAPELPEGVVVPNNFMYSTPPQELDRPRLLAAVANLSWTHAMAETFGRRSAGDGVLLTYIRELDSFPVLDPRQLTATEGDSLLEAYEQLAKDPVLPVTEELQRPERQAFDRLGMAFLVGSERAADAANTVARALRDLTIERAVKAAAGREYQHQAKSRQTFDPEPIAARVVELEGPPPDFRVLLGDIDPDAISSIVLQVQPHERASSVEVGSSLLDQGAVVVNGLPLLSAPTVGHAHAIRAALATDLDLAGPLVLPLDEETANQAVAVWESALATWSEGVKRRVQNMLPGAQRARRREAVLGFVERQTGLLAGLLQ